MTTFGVDEAGLVLVPWVGGSSMLLLGFI